MDITIILIVGIIVLGLFIYRYKLLENFTRYPNTRLAIPNECGCDGTFTQDMYHIQLNPFDWGFTYSTDEHPTFYGNNAVPEN